MTPRSRWTLLLLPVLSGAAAVLLLQFSGGRGARVAGPVGAPGSLPSHGEGEEPPPPGDLEPIPRHRSGPQETPPATLPAGAPAEGADEAPLLTLALRERRSRSPLPGFGLRVRQGSREFELRTDDQGRVEWPAPPEDGIVHLWHLPRPHPKEFEAAWELEPWRIEPGQEARTVIVDGIRPELVIEVITLDASEEPLPGVEVALIHGWRDREDAFHSEFVEEETSDAAGHARIPVSGPQAQSTSVMLRATDRGKGLASSSLFLDPPLQRGPWTLILRPTGDLELKVFGHDGQPLPAGSARATTAETFTAARTEAADRVQGGRARLEGLAEGSYRVSVTDSLTGDSR